MLIIWLTVNSIDCTDTVLVRGSYAQLLHDNAPQAHPTMLLAFVCQLLIPQGAHAPCNTHPHMHIHTHNSNACLINLAIVTSSRTKSSHTPFKQKTKAQTYQVSRIGRESHHFTLNLTLSLLTLKISFYFSHKTHLVAGKTIFTHSSVFNNMR